LRSDQILFQKDESLTIIARQTPQARLEIEKTAEKRKKSDDWCDHRPWEK